MSSTGQRMKWLDREDVWPRWLTLAAFLLLMVQTEVLPDTVHRAALGAVFALMMRAWLLRFERWADRRWPK